MDVRNYNGKQPGEKAQKTNVLVFEKTETAETLTDVLCGTKLTIKEVIAYVSGRIPADAPAFDTFGRFNRLRAGQAAADRGRIGEKHTVIQKSDEPRQGWRNRQDRRKETLIVIKLASFEVLPVRLSIPSKCFP